MKPHQVAALALAGVLAASLTTAGGADRIAYPEGYRAWAHVKSMVIHDRAHPLFEAFGGIHHVYVNSRGAAAARAGGPYPDGTVFVFDLLEAPAQGGAITEGARKFVAVMVKDTAAFADTGGWGFQAFKGSSRDQRLVTEAKTQCFACHQSQKPRDYVFSTWRD
jgi:hypothetical protein